MEYTAGLATGEPRLEAQRLFEQLLSSGEWLEHEKSETRLMVRYAGAPPRLHWPEDVLVEVSPSEVSVLFHAGSGAQRGRLLAVLEEAIRKQGVTACFEER